MKMLNRKIEKLNSFQIIFLIIYVAVILLIAIKLPIYLYNKDYEKRKGYSKEFSIIINTLKDTNIEKLCNFISTSNNKDIKLITSRIKNEYCLNNNISLNQEKVYEKIIEDLDKKETFLILKYVFKNFFYFSLFIFIISLGFFIFPVAFIFFLLIAIGFPFMITFLNIIIGS